VHDQIGLPVVHVLLELGSTVRGGDIRDKSDDMRQRLDRVKVDTDDETALGHVLFGHLQPTSRGRTKIDGTFRFGEKVVFSVQVDQLAGECKRRPGIQDYEKSEGGRGSPGVPLTKPNELDILAPWQACRTCPNALFLFSCRVYPSCRGGNNEGKGYRTETKVENRRVRESLVKPSTGVRRFT
jgi:hypothetical protein